MSSTHLVVYSVPQSSPSRTRTALSLFTPRMTAYDVLTYALVARLCSVRTQSERMVASLRLRSAPTTMRETSVMDPSLDSVVGNFSQTTRQLLDRTYVSAIFSTLESSCPFEC